MENIVLIFLITFLLISNLNLSSKAEESKEEKWQIIGNSWNGTVRNLSTADVLTPDFIDIVEDNYNKRKNPDIKIIEIQIELCMILLTCIILIYTKNIVFQKKVKIKK